MKKHILVITAIAALLCGFLACAGVVSAEDGEKYKITVEGGYATAYDVNGNKVTVTEASSGTGITIYPERKAGVYVTGWETDFNGRQPVYYGTDGTSEFTFRMPPCDVTIKAVTAAQKPCVIDLRGGYCALPDYEIYASDGCSYSPIAGWVLQAIGSEYEAVWYDSKGIDLDGDGNKDILLVGTEGFKNMTQFAAIPAPGGNLHGEYKLEGLSDGPLWPYTVRFPEENVEKSYAISISEGVAQIYNQTIYDYQEVKEMKPGESVRISVAPEEGTYVKGWALEGETETNPMFRSEVGGIWYFNMPARDITIHPVKGKQEAYTIDLSKTEEIPNEVGQCLSDSIGDDYFVGDLDGDGTRDFSETPHDEKDKYYLTFLQCPGSNIKGDYVVDKPNHGRYWPITMRFGEMKEDYSISVTGGHAIDRNGRRITSAAVGEKVTIVRDYESGVFWKKWEADFTGGSSDSIIYGFIMPAQDVHIKAVTVTSQTPVNIDLTNDWIWLGERNVDERQLIIENAMRANYDYGWFGFSVASGGEPNMWLDADGNGTDDIGFGASYDGTADVIRGSSYSLGESFSYPVKDGAYGPIIFTVNATKAVPPLPMKNGSVHKIQVKNGVVLNEAGEVITEAKAGDLVTLRVYASAGRYVKDERYRPDGEKDSNGRSSFSCKIIMPDEDVSEAPEYAAKEPLKINLVERKDDEPYLTNIDMTHLAGKIVKEEDGVTFYDLDGDGQADVWLAKEYVWRAWIVGKTETAYDGTVILPAGEKNYQYSEIRFILSNGTKVIDETTKEGCYLISVTDGILEGESAVKPGDSVVIRPAPRDDGNYVADWNFEYDLSASGTGFGYSWSDGRLTFTMPESDIEVKGVLKKAEPLTIDLSEGKINLTTEAIECILDAVGGNNSMTVDLNGDGIDDVMLASSLGVIQATKDYSCGAEFTLNGATRGPYYPITFIYNPKEQAVTATPTPTPTAEASPEPTEAPTKDRENPRGENKGDSFNPLYLIPVAAALCAVLAAGAIWWRKKKKAAKAGGKEPAVEGPIDTMTDASADTVADSPVESAENDKE